jgi:threonine synthase
MWLYSTKDRSSKYTLQKAVMQSLPPDNGLFMPNAIPVLSQQDIARLMEMDFASLSYEVASRLLHGGLPVDILKEIVHEAINFPAPVISLDGKTGILELFHGPSLAFKDFGARFMSRLMGYFNRNEDKELTILVATSGDTGGAVAAGFLGTPGIRVVILYPSQKVSQIQELQLTTLGQNIHAIEIDGTFDDCQALVKLAFLDQGLNKALRLSSANSINIARLIPQSFYYFEAYKQTCKHAAEQDLKIQFVVPSGNFGNLTAGLLAKRMGLPTAPFIAATNANHVVPDYLGTGSYLPKPSVRTISNAMDVGSPSNFVRMEALYGSTWNIMNQDILGYWVTDDQTETTVRKVYKDYDYVIDPHGAVAFHALERYRESHPDCYSIVLETAHPAKFLDDMERILGMDIDIPESLQALSSRQKVATFMINDFASFKDYLLAL